MNKRLTWREYIKLRIFPTFIKRLGSFGEVYLDETHPQISKISVVLLHGIFYSCAFHAQEIEHYTQHMLQELAKGRRGIMASEIEGAGKELLNASRELKR